MKTLWAIILIFVLTDNLTGQNTRKNTFPIRITVCDSINHEPLFLATISLTQDNHKIIAGRCCYLCPLSSQKKARLLPRFSSPARCRGSGYFPL